MTDKVRDIEVQLEQLHRQSMRVRAQLVARRHATTLCEMACDEARLLGETEAYRIYKAKAETATQIAEMIDGLSLKREIET